MKRRPLTPEQLLARTRQRFAPKLDGLQQRDLELCHLVNLDAIASGTAEPDILWHWVGSVLLWHRVAQQLGVHELAMTGQLDVATRLVERFAATNRVMFDDADYHRARIGHQVMTDLAAIVDRPTAIEAANWSEIEVNRIADGARQAAGQQQEEAHA